MGKKLFKIQIFQTIFMIILFLVAVLEEKGVMHREKSFMSFYVFSCIIFWIIMMVTLVITMHKNKKKEKKIFIFGIILSFEILLLGIFCGMIDSRVDLIEFTKHCEKTTATVYDIEVDTRMEPSAGEDYRYTVIYTYRLEYYVDINRYTTYFTEGYSERSRIAVTRAERDPKYEIGDEFSIYYNTEDFGDCRMNIGYLTENALSIFAFIIIGLRGAILGKFIMDYAKEKKEISTE